MKNINQILILIVAVVVSSCSSTQSLQEYFVDSSENPNFLKFDIPSSILNLEKANLEGAQKEAFESLQKLNILAFKKSESNAAEYEIERTKVKAILKGKDFTELMKMSTPYGKATVKYLGTEDAIDEVVIYGDNQEKGFALIRVLGKNMNPAHMVHLIEALKKSEYKGEGLEKIEELLKS